MDWDGVIEHQTEALKRILVALAAMAGLLDAARFRLPPRIYRAVLRPLRAAEEAALRLPNPPADTTGTPDAREGIEAARFRRRFVALARAIADLIRRLLAPGPGVGPEPARAVDRPATAGPCRTHMIAYPDTS